MKKFKEQFDKMTKLTLSVLLIVTLLFVSSCKDDDDPMPPETNTIVDVASADSELSTLVDAIKAAGLVDFLSGEGPFTVFAPTNAAFQKLDPATLNTIISTPSLLTALLQYHVANGKVLSTDLSNGSVQTLLSTKSRSIN